MPNTISQFAAFLSLACAAAFMARAETLKASIGFVPAHGVFLDEQGTEGVEAANASNHAYTYENAYHWNLDNALHTVSALTFVVRVNGEVHSTVQSPKPSHGARFARGIARDLRSFMSDDRAITVTLALRTIASY
jgi:hypothetical protein